ncbi:MAG TPA: gliding motility-associated C-terminal domain-containing protein [Chitinophagaceae bacterium]
MKYKVVILVFCFALISSQLFAQIVNGNCFIKANHLELGIGPCGVFGTTVEAPPGFHPRSGLDNPFRLGFIADHGRDGWDVGTPNYCGDYFVPGTPEEGWGITMNGKSYNNNLLCDGPEIPGSIIHYTNNGAMISGTWQGIVNGLEITAKTSVPVDKLYFLTEVTLRNVSLDTIRNLYYMRNIDPDNEVTLTEDYVTRNTIVSQNPNPDNRAIVTAEGLVYGCFIGLGTRDCRARVALGGFSNRSAEDAWNCVDPHQCSGSITDDIAITISFKLSDLVPGRQVSFKFVNVLNLSDVDESVNLTGPSFLIGGSSTVSANDTSQICSSGPTVFEVINTGGFDSWTWSPATGLNTIVGSQVICNGNIDTITYTATGQNSCGSTINIQLTAIKGDIVRVPKAGSISGPTNLCLPNSTVTYSIAPLPQATNYKWRVPPGCSILSGDGTNSILVNLGSIILDSIWVYGINVCGSGDTSLIRVRLIEAGPELIKYTFVGDSTSCEGRSSKLKAVYSISDGNVTNFLWYKDGIVIPGATDSILTVDSSARYCVELTTSYGCNYMMRDTTLIFFPVPVAAIKIPDGCVEGNFSFMDSSLITYGSITNWIWKNEGAVFSIIQNPITNFPAGLYNIQLTVSSDRGCWSEPTTASFLRYGKPQADFSISGICSNNLTQFNASTISPGYGNNNIVNWNWDFGNNQTGSTQDPSLVYNAAGYYDVKLTYHADNCTVMTNSVVRRIHIGDAVPAMKYYNVVASEGEQFVLYGGGDGVSYTWSPPTGLMSPNNRVTRGTLQQSQLYNVQVVNSYGCIRTDSVQVIILSDCKIYVPTGFTPNQDGLNDKFRIYAGCLKALTRFTIYNRWGQVIFTTKNGSDSWNGKYKGVDQPGGSYVWIAEGEYKSGKKFSEKGTFTLIR